MVGSPPAALETPRTAAPRDHHRLTVEIADHLDAIHRRAREIGADQDTLERASRALSECRQRHLKSMHKEVARLEDDYHAKLEIMKRRFDRQVEVMANDLVKSLRAVQESHARHVKRFSRCLCRDLGQGGVAEINATSSSKIEDFTWTGRQGRTWKQLNLPDYVCRQQDYDLSSNSD